MTVKELFDHPDAISLGCGLVAASLMWEVGQNPEVAGATINAGKDIVVAMANAIAEIVG